MVPEEKMTTSYTVNDLFCGCGGIGLGFKQAGYITTGAWDIDKYAVMSYKENVDDIATQADITKMTYKDLPKADVWTFGFPCQDLSVAGTQEGLFRGKRSGLFFEVMRLLDETRGYAPENLPAVIMAENVKGLKKYLSVLEEEYIKRGYKYYCTLYNSKYWYVPQNRERYFIIGVRDDIKKEFVFPTEQHDFVPALSTMLEKEVDEKYYIADDKAQAVIEQVYKNYSPTLRSRQGQKVIQAIDHSIDVIGRLNMKSNDCNRRVYNPTGISPTLTTSQGGNTQPKIIDYTKYRVRKLTPTEYGRLQGFPMDTWKQVVSDNQAYKQFGNAVTVTIAKALAAAIKGTISHKVRRGHASKEKNVEWTAVARADSQKGRRNMMRYILYILR